MKEARRAVAHCALMRLSKFDVFDDYLLPISSQVHEADKQHVRDVPAIMTVSGILGVWDSNSGSMPSLSMDVRLLKW